MWLIVGTSPQLPHGHLAYGHYDVTDANLILDSKIKLNIERGTDILAATIAVVCQHINAPKPLLLCAYDRGDGEGSKQAYDYLIKNLSNILPQGITFHYLFPDVDWHNKVLLSIEELEQKPTLVADAGFMYVAKMSGYADKYDLFTPDVGELSFLADELAPHPFYTRGFLLESEDSIENLLQRVQEHKNSSTNLIVKGSMDYVVINGKIVSRVNEPSVASMEAIGGTGDMVTGIASGLLSGGFSMQEACTYAIKTNRILAKLANPTPATTVGELITFLHQALNITLKG